MTYKYCAVSIRKENEILFCFVDLPSGILSVDSKEELLPAMEDTLMDLLEDEDFLPHDMLPPYRKPEEEELRQIVEKVFSLPYRKEEVEVFDVIVSE